MPLVRPLSRIREVVVSQLAILFCALRIESRIQICTHYHDLWITSITTAVLADPTHHLTK